MVEPITTVGLGAIGAYLGKDVITKLLGPTAEYLGEGMRDLVSARAEALRKIITRATQKVGDKIEEPGVVPPKILKNVISDGSFATEEVEIEYFAGILAASRTQDGKNDRGIRALRTIQSMSTDQIRAHYILYSCIVSRYSRCPANINDDNESNKLQILLSFESFLIEMGLSVGNNAAIVASHVADTIPHSLHGLKDDGLISNNVAWGPANHIRYKWVNSPGIVVAPTRSGLELFRLGLGVNHIATNSILLDSDIQSRIDKALVERINTEVPPRS